LAFMHYKRSAFALKVVGKGKAAKLELTNPAKFKKALEKIPNKGWVKCAKEGGMCKFKGTTLVKYGAKGKFKILQKTNGTPCTSKVMGDPIKGTKKTCYYKKVSKWTKCANEGGTCKFKGTTVVKYGAKGKFKILQKTNGTPCTSGVLGDPIKGAKKTCYYKKEEGNTKWACSNSGRALKATYDSAMKFWNHKAFEIYGRDCSKTGGRCDAAKKIIMPYTFKGVIGVTTPLPSDVATTWWAHKMDCMPTMKKVAHLHSSANVVSTSSLTLVVAAVTMALWTVQH